MSTVSAQWILNKCHKSKTIIIILIDTHLSEKQEACLTKWWGQMCYYNSLCSNLRWIAGLMKDFLKVKNIWWQPIIKRNYAKLSFELNKWKYLVKCLYAFHKDLVVDNNNNKSTYFFRNIFDDLEEGEYDNTIMARDYNLAINHNINTNLHVNNQNSRRYIMARMTMNDLTDIWQEWHPEKREFTFDKMQKK